MNSPRLLFLLFPLLLALAQTSPVRAEGEVTLVAAFSVDCPPVSGCFATPGFWATIEVKNLAFQKQVELVYTVDGNRWSTFPARYQGQSSAGKELWTIAGAPPPTQFAIAYTVDGRTYWDNAGGKNYQIGRHAREAILTYPVIGGARGHLGANGLDGTVFLKNLDPAKVVHVVYTDDGWETVKVADATYGGTLPSGVEWWRFELPVDAEADPADVELAFEYRHAQGSEWDDNYGKNYRVVNGEIAR